MPRETSYPGVYVQEIPSGVRPIAAVATANTAFVGVFRRGPFNVPLPIASFADLEREFGGLDTESPASYAVQQFFLNGGKVAFVVRAGSEPVSAETLIEGMESLDSIAPEVFNLLVVPDAAELATDSERRATYAAAERYCAERRAFLLVDVPEAVTTPAEVIDWMTKVGSALGKNAAVYFPRLSVVDQRWAERRRTIGAGGTLAGIYARTDSRRGVWKAPAGTEASIRGASPATRVDATQGGDLNARGVNVMRTFPGFGFLVWGARTLDGAAGRGSEWKYVPVRRTALHIEESLRRGLDWVVFEPNDEPLWARIRASAGGFLHQLYRRGAFQGVTPREAYFVKCDAETTTPSDIESGVVHLVIGFAPLKPAEFVLIRIQQRAGQIET